MSSKGTDTISLESSPKTYPRVWLGCLIGFSLLAYLPFFNNGFIADDWVVLDRALRLTEQPFHLFGVPPDQFRLTSYLCFLLLGSAVGHQALAFYLFAWMLHAVNALLTVHLARGLLGDAKAAWTAGLCFAIIQNPHEAVAWLSAINESLMVLFLLLLVSAWRRERYLWASAAFLAALFSKESALIALFLLPIVDLVSLHWGVRGANAVPLGSGGSNSRPQSDPQTSGHQAGTVMPNKAAQGSRLRPYAYLIPPLACFVAAYLWAWQDHSMLRAGYYSFGFHALAVILNSLHRLAFPYLYLAVLGLLVGRASLFKKTGLRSALASPAARGLALGAAGASIALLPYSFLTYQGHLPSRQTYLASLVLCLALGLMVRQISSRRLRAGFLAVFMVGNAAYLWVVKDAQFEDRAAPTVELRRILANSQPRPVILSGFPLNPWIARLAAGELEGWTGDELRSTHEDCPGCLELRWDAEAREYKLEP